MSTFCPGAIRMYHCPCFSVIFTWRWSTRAMAFLISASSGTLSPPKPIFQRFTSGPIIGSKALPVRSAISKAVQDISAISGVTGTHSPARRLTSFRGVALCTLIMSSKRTTSDSTSSAKRFVSSCVLP